MSGLVTNKGSQDKWQMVRSGFTVTGGQHRFAVKIVADASTTNTVWPVHVMASSRCTAHGALCELLQWRFIIGVIPASFPVGGKEWVGAHSSWGYIAGTGGKCHQVAKSLPYGEPYGGGDVIGISLDFDRATIEFFKNGVSQGALCACDLVSKGTSAGCEHLCVSGSRYRRGVHGPNGSRSRGRIAVWCWSNGIIRQQQLGGQASTYWRYDALRVVL